MGGIGDFIGDTIGSITRPVLGKPDPSATESATNASTGMTNFLSQMAQNYWNATAPVRDSVLSRLSEFMGGNFDPTASPMYAPIKSSTEQQYGTARDKIMETLPVGGALSESLADLESNKANTMSSLISQLVLDEYNKAYGIASGSPQTSQSGISSALAGNTGLLSALTGQTQAGNSLFGNLASTGASIYNTMKTGDLSTLLALLK